MAVSAWGLNVNPFATPACQERLPDPVRAPIRERPRAEWPLSALDEALLRFRNSDSEAVKDMLPGMRKDNETLVPGLRDNSHDSRKLPMPDFYAVRAPGTRRIPPKLKPNDRAYRGLQKGNSLNR